MFAALDHRTKRKVIFLLISLAFALTGLANGVYRYLQSNSAPEFEEPVANATNNCSAGFYPDSAAQQRQQGTNRIDFTIARDGSVKDAKVTQSSGFPALDQAAISCVRSWHYRPARVNGEAVSTPWRVELDWRLGERP